MRQFMMMVMALAALGAMMVTAQAENKSVSRTARAAESASTCTGLKLACLGSVDRGATASQWPVKFYRRESSCRYLGGSTPAPDSYCKNLCNSTWEQCMKTGFWEGRFLHRSAERR
jgi:hypothetical protein